MHPAMEIDKSILQPGFILLPRDAVYSWRRFPLQGVKAVPKQIHGHMVKQSGETFLLPCFRYFSHTAQSLGHSFPALCRTRVGLNNVLLGPRPSLPTLRRERIFPVVRLVHRYYGVVRLL